eukprot:3918435-Rhodomonas_salina.2
MSGTDVADPMLSGTPRTTIGFPQVLQKIGSAALGVIYTDPAYPRGMVPVAYTRLREAFRNHATGQVTLDPRP